MWKRQGNLFIVSAPSGAGKTTLCHRLAAEVPGIRLSVSYTTRKPRKGEVNDRDYTFTDEKNFRRMIEEGDFTEWARVHGNFYGTSGKRLQDMMQEGVDVILDIDTQGAKQMRKNHKRGVYIFILPPSMDILLKRLKTRMSDSADDIDMRIKTASKEIKEYKNYDYVIVNDKIDTALAELKSVIISDRIRTDRLDQEWVRKL